MLKIFAMARGWRLAALGKGVVLHLAVFGRHMPPRVLMWGLPYTSTKSTVHVLFNPLLLRLLWVPIHC